MLHRMEGTKGSVVELEVEVDIVTNRQSIGKQHVENDN